MTDLDPTDEIDICPFHDKEFTPYVPCPDCEVEVEQDESFGLERKALHVVALRDQIDWGDRRACGWTDLSYCEDCTCGFDRFVQALDALETGI